MAKKSNTIRILTFYQQYVVNGSSSSCTQSTDADSWQKKATQLEFLPSISNILKSPHLLSQSDPINVNITCLHKVVNHTDVTYHMQKE
eukprot:gene9086-6379_t